MFRVYQPQGEGYDLCILVTEDQGEAVLACPVGGHVEQVIGDEDYTIYQDIP